MSESYRLLLSKEDFKFSAAHFTLFSAEEAEPLHGHNYRVTVEVAGPSLDDLGFLVEFNELKKVIREQCAALDDRVLLPTASPHVEVEEDGNEVRVRYADRHYVFPRAEVRLLAVENTTVEVFARELWRTIAARLPRARVEWLQIGVQETDGQRCCFRAPLPGQSGNPRAGDAVDAGETS